jgi:hypothetical protein
MKWRMFMKIVLAAREYDTYFVCHASRNLRLNYSSPTARRSSGSFVDAQRRGLVLCVQKLFYQLPLLNFLMQNYDFILPFMAVWEVVWRSYGRQNGSAEHRMRGRVGADIEEIIDLDVQFMADAEQVAEENVAVEEEECEGDDDLDDGSDGPEPEEQSAEQKTII